MAVSAENRPQYRPSVQFGTTSQHRAGIGVPPQRNVVQVLPRSDCRPGIGQISQMLLLSIGQTSPIRSLCIGNIGSIGSHVMCLASTVTPYILKPLRRLASSTVYHKKKVSFDDAINAAVLSTLLARWTSFLEREYNKRLFISSLQAMWPRHKWIQHSRLKLPHRMGL